MNILERKFKMFNILFWGIAILLILTAVFGPVIGWIVFIGGIVIIVLFLIYYKPPQDPNGPQGND